MINIDVKEQILIMLKETIEDLVKENYDKIQAKIKNGIQVEDIQRQLEYGERFTYPPSLDLNDISFYEYNDGSGYGIEYDLWINNKKSDFTLMCDILIDKKKNITDFVIEDLHVL